LALYWVCLLPYAMKWLMTMNQQEHTTTALSFMKSIMKSLNRAIGKTL
jgi:hypothetical protein